MRKRGLLARRVLIGSLLLRMEAIMTPDLYTVFFEPFCGKQESLMVGEETVRVCTISVIQTKIKFKPSRGSKGIATNIIWKGLDYIFGV